MRQFIAMIIIAGILASCDGSGAGTDKRIISRSLRTAEKYAAGQFAEPERFVSADKTVIIGDNQKKYSINRGRVFTGHINDDRIKDAIVSIDAYQGEFQIPSEQLVLLGNKGKFVLAGAIEYDMRVIGIENGLITAIVPTHTRNSPLFNCSECTDTVIYRFAGGKFVEPD